MSAIDASTQTAGHQGFTYLGEGSTSRSVDAGGLKFYHVNGNTYIVGDVNGDGQADIQIEIAGTHDLTADSMPIRCNPGARRWISWARVVSAGQWSRATSNITTSMATPISWPASTGTPTPTSRSRSPASMY